MSYWPKADIASSGLISHLAGKKKNQKSWHLSSQAVFLFWVLLFWVLSNTFSAFTRPFFLDFSALWNLYRLHNRDQQIPMQKKKKRQMCVASDCCFLILAIQHQNIRCTIFFSRGTIGPLHFSPSSASARDVIDVNEKVSSLLWKTLPGPYCQKCHWISGSLLQGLRKLRSSGKIDTAS